MTSQKPAVAQLLYSTRFGHVLHSAVGSKIVKNARGVVAVAYFDCEH